MVHVVYRPSELCVLQQQAVTCCALTEISPPDPRRIAKDLYTAMLRDSEEDVEEILSYPPEQVAWAWRDMSGATLLHHVARLGWPSVVRRVWDREPSTGAMPTHIGARPSLWLPLHVATERAVQTDEERAVAASIVGLLAAAMDDVDFAALTSSRSNALHFVAGKGAHWLVAALVDGRQMSVLSAMMEQRNERARREQVFFTTARQSATFSHMSCGAYGWLATGLSVWTGWGQGS